MSDDRTEIGRLAMRQEGEWWKAYYAMPDTMTGAIELGSIRLNAVISNHRRKTAFMDIMRELVAELIEENTGQRPTWGGVQTAPETERSGNA